MLVRQVKYWSGETNDVQMRLCKKYTIMPCVGVIFENSGFSLRLRLRLDCHNHLISQDPGVNFVTWLTFVFFHIRHKTDFSRNAIVIAKQRVVNTRCCHESVL